MLENVKIQRNQIEYFGVLMTFLIIVIPFQKMAIEKITREHVKIKLVFCRIPKYETGCSLGSKSGNRYKHIKGEMTPIIIENER